MEKKVSEAYPELFHYTTGEGLLGILETNSIWAANYKYLNDSKEFLQFREYLACFIRDKTHGKSRLNFSDALIAGIEGTDILYSGLIAKNNSPSSGYNPFITSFCSHTSQYEKRNGLLSQWRGYSGSTGYLIVFETEKFEKQLFDYSNNFSSNGAFLLHVVYSEDKESIKEFINPRCEQLFELLECFINDESPSNELSKSALLAMIRCATGYKHKSFREEKEIRLVISPVDSEYDIYLKKKFSKKDYPRKNLFKINYRGNITNPIKYIKMFNGYEEKLPIKQIIVGPSLDKEKRRDAVLNYLEKNHINIPNGVICSDTPLI